MKVEITEVERLALQPGDRLIVHVARRLTDQDADRIKGRIRAILEIPDEIPVLIVDPGIAVSVLTP